MQTFTTKRMWLRPVAPNDLDALLELDSDPEVMRYISGGRASSRAEYEGEDGLLARMRAYVDRPYGYFTALEGGPEGAFLGWFHLRPSVFEPDILELGYRLRRACWGRGLATEGGQRLVAHAFDGLGQRAVDGCTMPENTASAAVLRKCGMRFVGMARHPRIETSLARYVVEAARSA